MSYETQILLECKIKEALTEIKTEILSNITKFDNFDQNAGLFLAAEIIDQYMKRM